MISREGAMLNQNRDQIIKVRITSDQLAAIKRAARERHQTVSEFVRAALNRALEEQRVRNASLR
jgi:uncharacterized protein (DUF1778 family)